MDRRRFCDVSKTRPRRPQDPPPVRRHPKRIPNLASARLPFSLSHFLALSGQFCSLPRFSRTFRKFTRPIEQLSSAILTCTLNATHVTFDDHFSRKIDVDKPILKRDSFLFDQLYQLHERRAFLKLCSVWTGNTSHMNEHIRVLFFSTANTGSLH